VALRSGRFRLASFQEDWHSADKGGGRRKPVLTAKNDNPGENTGSSGANSRTVLRARGPRPARPVRIECLKYSAPVSRNGKFQVALDLYGAFFLVKAVFLGFAHSSLFGAGKGPFSSVACEQQSSGGDDSEMGLFFESSRVLGGLSA